MIRLAIEEEEARQVKAFCRELADRYGSAENPEFLADAQLAAHELPRRLRRCLNDFRLNEPASAMCVISGLPLDDAAIGATPSHWKFQEMRRSVCAEEMGLVLLSSLLGECIGWATQQDGHIVHDILPIKGMEHEQLGSGSEELLWWHIEDAFHECRGDYLGLMCLRNPDQVPTTFISIAEIPLSPWVVEKLFEPHYTIRPDESHLKKNKPDPAQIVGDLETSYDRIEQMNTRPDKIPVLFGDPRAPYIRIDPYFMDTVDDPAAQEALSTLIRAVDERIRDVPMDAGEICFIDNFQGVHGRKPFKARYDGRDRWLKRVNIARDLRRSRALRETAVDRVIH